MATAGAYLDLTGISVSEYLTHYETSWLELQQTSPPLLSYTDRALQTTWNLSYEHIRKQDELAAKLLELWAYFDNRDLWYDLLKGGVDESPSWFVHVVSTKVAFNSAIGNLRKHALIEKLTESDGYSMHHCVHAWVNSVLRTPVEDQNMKIACWCIVKNVPGKLALDPWVVK